MYVFIYLCIFSRKWLLILSRKLVSWNFLAYKNDLCRSEVGENSLRALMLEKEIHLNDVISLNTFEKYTLPQQLLYCFLVSIMQAKLHKKLINGKKNRMIDVIFMSTFQETKLHNFCPSPGVRSGIKKSFFSYIYQ